MWQVAHWPLTLKFEWKRPLAQLLKLPLWQLSQLADAEATTVANGMWFAGRPSAGGNAPVWQLEHCAATAICVWFQLLGLKPVTVWQPMQFAAPTGMCPLGLPVTATPLWQLVQLVDALKLAWSGLAPAQPAGLWQPSQLVTPAWIAVLGLPVAPSALPVWHVEHWLVTLKFAWNRPLAQLLKLPLWQLSQVAETETLTEAEAMWLLGRPLAGGNVPVWQLAHCADTGTCVWFQLLGLKLTTLWQLLQLALPVGMWPLDLPATATPLWHELQLVAASKVAWSGLAPDQPLVLWQASQAVTPAWMAVPGLPAVAR